MSGEDIRKWDEIKETIGELSKDSKDNYKVVIKLKYPFDSGVDLDCCEQSK